MRLLLATFSLGMCLFDTASAIAQIDLSDALPGVRKLPNAFEGDVRVSPGAVLTFNEDIPSVKVAVLQNGKQANAKSDARLPQIQVSIPTKVFDEKLKAWRDTDWSIAKGDSFTVNKITAYRSAFDNGSYNIGIHTSNGKVQLHITCVIPESVGRHMTSQEFRAAIGNAIRVSNSK